MVLQFLCARYPQYFWLSNNNKTFRNSILNTDTDLTTTQPLHVLLNNVPEDFAIMLRNDKTGLYVFRAGIICSALGWNVGSKIGLNLSGIHGPIPDYKEKMQFSMDRCVHTCMTSSSNDWLTWYTGTLPKSLRINRYNAAPGAWKLTSRSTCLLETPTKHTARDRTPRLTSLVATSASIGRHCVAYPSLAPSSSTSRPCLRRWKNSGMSHMCRG